MRTIVNLRGGRSTAPGSCRRTPATGSACDLVEFVVRSRGAPDRDTILGAKDFFAELQYPAVIHCKSGADRAGFVAALYLVDP